MNAQRAKALLIGGLIGAHLAGLLVVLGWAAARGMAAAMSALISAGLVVAFFGVGQAVMVAVAEAQPATVLVAALGSYVFRAAVLAALFGLATANSERLAALDRPAAFTGVLVVTLGWLVGEVHAFRRLRIPVYDADYRPPPAD